MLKSTLLLLAAAASIVFTAIGTSQQWDPVDVGLMVALSVALLSIAMLDRALSRAGAKAERSDEKRAITLVDRTVIAAFAGLLTGLMFLLCYYFIDFTGDSDISERHVDAICGALGWPPFAPNPALVKGTGVPWPYPSLLRLIPEFILTGGMIGLIVGYLVPVWHRFAVRLSKTTVVLGWLRSIWGSYLTFGLLWGFSIGIVFNMFIFAKSDGRPFLSIYAAVLAASLSVLSYVLLETIRLMADARKQLNGRMASEFVGITLAALGIAIFYAMADRAFDVTPRAYCHFYSAWDTKLNRLQTTPSVLFVAALYGTGIGLLVMWLVASFSVVESTYRRHLH